MKIFKKDTIPHELKSIHIGINFHSWNINALCSVTSNGSKFGYVSEGVANLHIHNTFSDKYQIRAGMYFLTPDACTIEGGSGIIICCQDYAGIFMIGGPLEASGRLIYIDGCTDSLIIPPDKLGNPCLNHLVFPPNTNQTFHTHPSIRIGLVAEGSGWAMLRNKDGNNLIRSDLQKGSVFIIPENTIHCFHTDSEYMHIVAFHPDSDTGSTDKNHPMINKTFIDGNSANIC